MIWMKASVAIAALALSAGPTCAQAAANEPSPDDAIVVRGHAILESKIVAEQAKQITLRPNSGEPLAHQYQALCVKVFGLPPPVASAVKARIEQNARSFHTPVADGDCTANAWVGIFKGGKDAAQRLRVQHPWLFEGLSNHQVEQIFASSSSAFAWHRTEERNADGSIIPMAEVKTSEPKVKILVRVNKLYRPGRLVSPIRMDLATSIVLIDAQSAVGKSIGQISDYATMRLLGSVTDAHVTDDTALPTILSLFTAPSPPSSLTAFDRAYLSGLQRLGTGALSPAIADATASAFRQQKPGKLNTTTHTEP